MQKFDESDKDWWNQGKQLYDIAFTTKWHGNEKCSLRVFRHLTTIVKKDIQVSSRRSNLLKVIKIDEINENNYMTYPLQLYDKAFQLKVVLFKVLVVFFSIVVLIAKRV